MYITRLLKMLLDRAQSKEAYDVSRGVIEKMRKGDSFTKLTPDQEHAVQSYFQKYTRKKIDLAWHEYYMFANGLFSEKYLPTYLYYRHIVPKLNNSRFSVAYADKNMMHKLLGDRVKMAHTYVQNINGIFYSEEKVISKKEAVQLCQNIEDGIIKHSIDSMQGNSITRFSSTNGKLNGKKCPETIDDLLTEYGSNYVVQAAIQQCYEMSKLNPTSLNTIRVMTYWSQNDGIVPLYQIVRMGRSGAVVDNASSGGLYCGVEKDGKLKEHAYTLYPFSKHTQNDHGIIFKNFSIPSFHKLLEKAVELHAQLPYTRIIGWDLTIDKDNEIVLVEINANKPGVFQVATGPAFGQYTDEVMEYCFKH